MARFRVSGSYFDRMADLDVRTETEETAKDVFRSTIPQYFWEESSLAVINFDEPPRQKWLADYQRNQPWEEGRKFTA